MVGPSSKWEGGKAVVKLKLLLKAAHEGDEKERRKLQLATEKSHLGEVCCLRLRPCGPIGAKEFTLL